MLYGPVKFFDFLRVRVSFHFLRLVYEEHFEVLLYGDLLNVVFDVGAKIDGLGSIMRLELVGLSL